MILELIWKPIVHAWRNLLFLDIAPLVIEGYKQPLTPSSLDKYYNGSFNSGILSNQLEMAMNEIKQKNAKQAKSENINILKSAIWKIHHKSIAFIIFLVLCSTAFKFVGIIFFQELLDWFDRKDAPYGDGWLWGTFFVFSSVIGNIIYMYIYYMGYVIGLKIKLALLASIHKKILRLNTSIVSWQSTGQIINFASTDLKFFDEGIQILPYIIAGPLELVMSFLFIGAWVGWLASFLGFLVMVLLLPMQGAIISRMRTFKEKALKVTDERINATSQMIVGILAVKCFTWENSIFSKIKTLRNEEQKHLCKILYILSIAACFYGFATAFIPLITFTIVILKNGSFDVSLVFFTLAILNMASLSFSIVFPYSLGVYVQLTASFRRLNRFLNLKEPLLMEWTDTDKFEPNGTIDANIVDYGWLIREKESEENELKKPLKNTEEMKSIISLHDIKFKVNPGELIGIVGEVGSGKSSLLLALLGEMQDLTELNDEIKTYKQIYGSVSYCSQSPWIMSATIKDNILFGSNYDEKWYDTVIKSCSLDVDLEQFEAGDQTELGERGINISGGQKARVSLARAAYKKTDVNLLDDPLSAVDPKVANKLFESCIGNNGIMKNKTRILVSHQVQFMPHCDRIIIMDSGQIVAMDTYQKLMESEYNQVFKKTLEKYSKTDIEKENKNVSSSISSDVQINYDEVKYKIDENKTNKEEIGKLIEEETKAIGKVSWKVYWTFIKYFGHLKIIIASICMIMLTAMSFYVQFWLFQWGDAEPSEQDDAKWIIGLSIICLLVLILSICIGMSTRRFILISFSKINLAMLKSVLSAPLSFFHKNPSGRIINRFSKDQSMADSILVNSLYDIFVIFFVTIGSVIVICITLPYAIIFYIIFLYLMLKLTEIYLKSSREVRRIDGITRSPIYEQLSENLKGLSTIHAFKMQNRFKDKFIPILNINGNCWYCFQRLVRWYIIRLDLMICLILIITTFVAVAIKDYFAPKYVSIALLNTMTILYLFKVMIKQYEATENGMTGVERMLEYTTLEKEAPSVEERANPSPRDWPRKGDIEFVNVSSRYRVELPPVLTDITFKISAGKSVGIIGRTGSGKSSLLLTLYRLIEKIEGNIYIDDLNIENIGLDALRKSLAIIPQDPILFEGTLRFNLDPWNQFSDAKLWNALNDVQLKEIISEAGGLDAQVSENGNNFSVGQRQLLCLARALLKDAKILTVDEATANVDNQTDNLVQSAIRKFIYEKDDDGKPYRTLFIVAHRLDTISDCDLLMVLDNGKLVEMGTPDELRMNSIGIFTSLLKASNSINTS